MYVLLFNKPQQKNVQIAILDFIKISLFVKVC